jgi:hypothetical protein
MTSDYICTNYIFNAARPSGVRTILLAPFLRSRCVWENEGLWPGPHEQRNNKQQSFQSITESLIVEHF